MRRFLRALPVIWAVLIVLSAAACSVPSARAFYYWKTSALPSGRELDVLRGARATRLYVHAADVDERGALAGAFRPAAVELRALMAEFDVVPVVYIVNDRFRVDGASDAALASSVSSFLDKAGWLSGGARELQIDCDWTASTRGRYFAFLGAVGKAVAGRGIALSATIRLHQTRDRDADGIPPVGRGMLMAYNLLNPAEPGARSAILDLEVLKDYLPSIRAYPLPLDVALPAWSWVAQFEGSAFLGLISEPGAGGEVRRGPFERLPDGRYRATAPCLVSGRTVEAGDLLVVDESTTEKTLAAARLLARVLPRVGRSVSLFHLDEATLEAFAGGDAAALSRIFEAFGR